MSSLLSSLCPSCNQMEKSDAYKKGSASGKKWDGGGPGGPGSGPYGGGPRGPPCGLDNVRGIDHSEHFFLFWLCCNNLFLYLHKGHV